MLENLTDAEVIERSWSEPGRFALLFERHFPAIHAYLLRRVGRDLADDIAAEAFLHAFASRHRYDLARNDARPWLFSIAVNLLRGHYRAERRQLRAFARTGVDPLEDGGLPAAEARADAGREGARIAGALASLGHAEREVLLLVAWADLTYRQISEALDIPLGTVQSRISRARAKLRRHLDSGHPHPQDEWVPVLGETALGARGEKNG